MGVPGKTLVITWLVLGLMFFHSIFCFVPSLLPVNQVVCRVKFSFQQKIKKDGGILLILLCEIPIRLSTSKISIEQQNISRYVT